MKIELISVCDMWEKLKDFDKKSVWNDDSVFESVSMDEFVDDVNEVYRDKEWVFFRGSWFWSSFVNLDEMGVNVSLDNNYGEYIEREVDEE